MMFKFETKEPYYQTYKLITEETVLFLGKLKKSFQLPNYIQSRVSSLEDSSVWLKKKLSEELIAVTSVHFTELA